ncbi:hypothetical protein B0T10DRAFT_480810 [Thelonectria olida]|uniref:Uncharacterized protein n=1 Tax=Thelonectria olida TaxID=1576542 RepID=A0A9P9AVQ2_9HYPO|nr:hypothetical protein B0T10DRAFT_480810 [Thelonectria olida]
MSNGLIRVHSPHAIHSATPASSFLLQRSVTSPPRMRKNLEGGRNHQPTPLCSFLLTHALGRIRDCVSIRETTLYPESRLRLPFTRLSLLHRLCISSVLKLACLACNFCKRTTDSQCHVTGACLSLGDTANAALLRISEPPPPTQRVLRIHVSAWPTPQTHFQLSRPRLPHVRNDLHKPRVSVETMQISLCIAAVITHNLLPSFNPGLSC